MKKIFFIALLFVFANSKAQQTSTPCWYNPTWDWIDATPSNWQAQIQGTTANMGSPFTTNNITTDMLAIIDGNDYLPQQGWVLLGRDFGCIGQIDVSYANPWFMLYNKYKGTVRLFMYVGNGNAFGDASVLVYWNNSAVNNSLFTHTNPYSKTNEVYPEVSNTEKFVNYLNEYPSFGGWVVTELQVNFDPNTTTNNVFQRIDFKITPSNTGDIILNGDFMFTTKSASVKGNVPASVPNNPNGVYNFVVGAQKFLGKAPKRSELESGFNQIASSVNNIDNEFCNDFTRDIHNMNESLQNGKLKKYLLGAADLAEGLGGGLAVAAKVLEFFVGKGNTSAATSNESYIQPTVSSGTMKLSGTMTTNSSPKLISLQLPGTGHFYSNGTENWSGMPVYDCPLGVIGLQEAPQIEVRTYQEIEYQKNGLCTLDFSTSSCTPPNQFNQTIVGYDSIHWHSPIYRRTTTCPAQTNYRTMKSYKVNGDIKLALNDASGVQIESTKAALFFQIKDNGQGTPALDMFQESETATNSAQCCIPEIDLFPNSTNLCQYNHSPLIGNSSIWYANTTYYEAIPYSNPLKNQLDNGILTLSGLDPSGYHKFQTPFIDMDKFKNTSITLPDGVNVFLKVLITMKPIDPSADPTPVVYVATYEIPQNKIANDPGTTPFEMTCQQQAELLTPTTTVGAPGLGVVIGNISYSGIYIANETLNNAQVIAAPTFVTEFAASERVSLKPGFETDIANSGGTFWGHIDQSGCPYQGENSLQIQNYFGACTPDPFSRLANSNSRKIKDSESSREIVEMETGIKMYIAPNPNNGNFKLLFNKEMKDGKIRINTVMGTQILELDVSKVGSVLNLNFSDKLSAGTYVLTFIDNEFILNQKFIVE